MNENNKIFVSILRTVNEEEPAKLVACYYCHSAVITVNPEYHWIRQVKMQTFDPFGILRDFLFELHDDEDVMIETR